MKKEESMGKREAHGGGTHISESLGCHNVAKRLDLYEYEILVGKRGP